MPGRVAAATSATLDVPVSTVTITAAPAAPRRLDGGQRQPVALLEPRRHVRHRRSRRSVRRASVRIASPVIPSASKSPKTRTCSPRSRACGIRARKIVRVREQAGVVQRAGGVAEEAPELGRVGHAPGAPAARRRAAPEAQLAPGLEQARGDGDGVREEPAGPRLRARPQDATRRCTAAFFRLSVRPVRRSRGGSCRASPLSGRAGDPPTPARRRGAGWR